MTETLRSSLDITAVRDRFSSLAGFTFLDAPGGTQVPDEVGDAIARAPVSYTHLTLPTTPYV